MTPNVPTIAETIAKIQTALRDYIEATYHVGHPLIIEQRRELLETEGVLFKAPFIESTPRYQTNQRFDDLDLDAAVHATLQHADPDGRTPSTVCSTTRRTPTKRRHWSGHRATV